MSRSSPAHSAPAPLLAAGAALLSAIFFGLNAIASKLLFAPPPHFDAVSLFTARGFWTAPLFLVLALAARPKPFPRLTAKAALLFFACGVFYGPGTNALIALGAERTSGGHSVLLLSLFPPLAATLAALILGERLSRLRIAAILLGIAGALILALSKSASPSSLTGDALIAGFVLAWALLVLGVRRLNMTWPPLFVVGVFGAIGGVLLTLIGIAAGRAPAIILPLMHSDRTMLLWFDLELVLLVSVAGQLLQGLALKRMAVAAVVALTSYMSIAAGIAGSFLLLGENLSAGEIVAGFFLVTALGLSLLPENYAPRWLRH